mgnify:CR=1 FL=1
MKSTNLTIAEASKELTLTPQQVRNLCRNGKIQAERFGRSWLIEYEEVKRYVANSNCGVISDKSFANPSFDRVDIDFPQPIALSFFSGAMGLDLGIEKAGFKTLLACEIDKASRKTIKRNKPNIALIGDIRDYSPQEIREKAGLNLKDDIDLIIGGPPCQAFSTAGKRKGFEDERGNVFLSFLDTIIALNPKFAVIENVRGILSAPMKHRPHDQRGKGFPSLEMEEMQGGALMNILNKLREAGYGVTFNLYNAANFGTPQKRERVIIIASREGIKMPYLKPTHTENGDNGLSKWVTFKDATEDLISKNGRHLNFPEKRLRFYRLLKPGQHWKHLPEDLQKEALGKSFYSQGGKTGFLRRLDWNKPSPTLVTHPAMPATDLCHPIENRPLSIEEYKRIQQFPDNWIIEGSLIDQYKQIGNAVPVGLGKAIGDLIIEHLNKPDKTKTTFTQSRFSRYTNTDDRSWENNFNQLIKKHHTKS